MSKRESGFNLFSRRVALIMLPTLIFLVIISIRPVSSDDIDAEVLVAPRAELTCLPNPLVVGHPREKVVTCFIELDNYDPSEIIPDTIRLYINEKPVTPIPILSDSPNVVDDFDEDTVPDLEVTFDKEIVNSWFSDLYLPFVSIFNIDFEVYGIPGHVFTTTDVIDVIKPSYTFVYFYGRGGDVRTIKGIDMSRATDVRSRLDKSAHQLVRVDQPDYIDKWTDIAGRVTGDMPVEILPGIEVYLGFTAWLEYDDDNCVFTPYYSVVCDGKGTLYKRGLALGYSSEEVEVHFETDGVTADLIGRQGETVVFEQLDIPLTRFDYVVKTESSFLFYV